MNTHDLASDIQAHVARITIGPSALRKQGPGVADAARPFLATLPLAKFATASDKVFARRLDEYTLRLQGKFPTGSGSWGLARKLLNIFLREALYNRYLAERYDLAVSEKLLEVPLDSITGKRLVHLEGARLPAWPGVKYLRPEVSAQFQDKANIHAHQKGIARVHLDAIWWGGRRQENEA
jgi:hypothetical protein